LPRCGAHVVHERAIDDVQVAAQPIDGSATAVDLATRQIAGEAVPQGQALKRRVCEVSS
jgi:hypothetical protein